jgi:acyl-CoA reductase-like NAD-dependent aldehyde dehydrogenase
VEQAMAELRRGAATLSQTGLGERIQIVREIRQLLVEHAREWVKVSCRIKSIETSAQRSEEILAGPATAARYLALLIASLESISRAGAPDLPGPVKALPDGRLKVPVFPARGLYDSLLFKGLRAEVWMQPGVTRTTLHGDLLDPLLDPPSVALISLVLGAGNVSAIPLTDSLTKLFHEGQVVLLKMNPVNEALLDVFCKVLAPLIERGWMQIIQGGAEVGQAAMQLDDVSTVHITGSHHTHDRIVWGGAEECQQRQRDNSPLLQKPITSELGNVSPWIFVPGEYSRKQLRFQATNLAASLVNNAGFNCVTTRVIVTWKQWSQREHFLDELDQALEMIPRRSAYYPGAHDRFERFTGQVPQHPDDGSLPWLILKDVDPQQMPQLFSDESFVPACAEVQLEADSPQDFLQRAADFCNNNLFGTLCAAITVPNPFRRQEQPLLERVISELNYGSVCINQWPGLVYGLMTPPWGAAPGSDLANIQSGIGNVHNLYFLDKYEKTVFHGPLTNFPKPIWFPSHQRAEKIAWKLVPFYGNPALVGLPGLLVPAMLG